MRFDRYRKDKEVKARSDNFGLSIRASQIPGNSKDWSPFTMSSGSLQDRRHLFLYLIQIRCRCCGTVFSVCRCCWRGQAYCCDECRIAKKRQNHSEVQRRYRQTAKGKTGWRLLGWRLKVDMINIPSALTAFSLNNLSLGIVAAGKTFCWFM